MFRRLISLIIIIAFVVTLGPLPSAMALRQTSAPQAAGDAVGQMTDEMQGGKAAAGGSRANMTGKLSKAEKAKEQNREKQRQENKAIAEIFGFSPETCFNGDGYPKPYIMFEGTRGYFTGVRHLPDSNEVVLAYTSRPGVAPDAFSLDAVVNIAGKTRILPADEKYEAITTVEEARGIAERITAGASGEEVTIDEAVKRIMKAMTENDSLRYVDFTPSVGEGPIPVGKLDEAKVREYVTKVCQDMTNSRRSTRVAISQKTPGLITISVVLHPDIVAANRIAEELAVNLTDPMLEIKFDLQGDHDESSVPQSVKEFFAEKNILTTTPEGQRIIRIAHTIAKDVSVIDRFNQFATGFHATRDNCKVIPSEIGRINANYFIEDLDTGTKYVVQKLGTFFDPYAIEYQLVSLEWAQQRAEEAGEFNEGGKFEHWTPVKYYNIIGPDGQEQLQHKHLYLGQENVWRVMEFVKNTTFYPDSKAIPEQYRAEAAAQFAKGIRMLDELLAYVPDEGPEGRDLTRKPLPLYHATEAHVIEMRELTLQEGRESYIVPIADLETLKEGEAYILPSRRDRMRPARMIPGLLDNDPNNPYISYRDRTLRLIEIFRRLTSAADGSIGFLTYDYQGPQDTIIADILEQAANTLADNDTKFDNAGFVVDEQGKPLYVTCFVDLDTIQKAGMRFIDFADGVQFPINPAGETPLEINDVTVVQDLFEKCIEGYMEGYTEEQKAALRPHLIWATAKIACELATRFFKAYLSEYADIDPVDPQSAYNRQSNGVYFTLPADTPRDENGVPLKDTDKFLRIAEARYKVALSILRLYAGELRIDINDIPPDPIGWGKPAVAAAMGTLDVTAFTVDEDNDVANVFNLADLSDKDALAVATLVSHIAGQSQRMPVVFIVNDKTAQQALLSAGLPQAMQENVIVLSNDINERQAVDVAVISVLEMNAAIKAVNYYSSTNSKILLRNYNGISVSNLPMPAITELEQLKNMLDQMHIDIVPGTEEKAWQTFEAAKALATGV